MNSKILIWGIPAIVALFWIGQSTGLLPGSEPIASPPPTPSVEPSPSLSPSPVAVTCPPGLESGDWENTAGNFWAGVKVYTGTGDCKQLLATIYGGNSDTVLLDYVSGDRDWKSRDAVGRDTWVNRNDPAMSQRLWRDIPGP